jgi:hypothetical protein
MTLAGQAHESELSFLALPCTDTAGHERVHGAGSFPAAKMVAVVLEAPGIEWMPHAPESAGPCGRDQSVDCGA